MRSPISPFSLFYPDKHTSFKTLYSSFLDYKRVNKKIFKTRNKIFKLKAYCYTMYNLQDKSF